MTYVPPVAPVNTDPVPLLQASPAVVTDPPSFLVSMIATGLRTGLVALGAVLVDAGYLNQSQAGALLQAGLGLAVVIAALIWSAIEKHTKITQINGLLGLLGTSK